MKIAKPPGSAMKVILEQEFENFIPAHGDPVLGGAKQKLKKYLDNYKFKN